MVSDFIQFWVPGIPRPGGSKKAFWIKSIGKPRLVDSCKYVKDWRAVVALKAGEAIKELFIGPVSVYYEFRVTRPKGHFGSGRNNGVLKASAPDFPTVKPDITKLIRSTEDAMTGIAWKDDSQIVNQVGIKRYADSFESPGALIVITTLEPCDEPESTELERAAWQDMVHGQ